jgi:hypothetical protein
MNYILKYANREGIRKKRWALTWFDLVLDRFTHPKSMGRIVFYLFRDSGKIIGRKFRSSKADFGQFFWLGPACPCRLEVKKSCCFWSSLHAKNGKEIFV